MCYRGDPPSVAATGLQQHTGAPLLVIGSVVPLARVVVLLLWLNYELVEMVIEENWRLVRDTFRRCVEASFGSPLPLVSAGPMRTGGPSTVGGLILSEMRPRRKVHLIGGDDRVWAFL